LPIRPAAPEAIHNPRSSHCWAAELLTNKPPGTCAHEIVLSGLTRPITDTMIRDEEVDPRLFGDPLARGRRNR